uniref:Uncharacterized protein n=1 Tax=Arcella intermedia TaxID=1963864 RepID=A0A6B2LQK1_9EUKA
MDPEVKKVLMEMEELGEDVITDKQQLVDFDRRRQHNREALRFLKEEQTDKDQWLFLGSFFLKKKKQDVIKIINTDQKTMDEEGERVQQSIKAKTTKLHQLEGRANEVKGFNLKPLGKEDYNAFFST